MVCYRLAKTLIASMSGVTSLEVLVYGDVNVPVIYFVRDKGGCSSYRLKAFSRISLYIFDIPWCSVVMVAPRESGCSSLDCR